jgi:hypothetical protein
VEAALLGSVDRFVRSRSGVYPYFHLPMSDPPVEWQKVWFFLRNDTNVPLPVFMASRLVTQRKWGYGVAQGHICRLQSLCDVVQWLLRGGLMGVDLLRTFVSCHVEPLRRREITMWMYPRPTYPNRSFSVELDSTEIRILTHVKSL